MLRGHHFCFVFSKVPVKAMVSFTMVSYVLPSRSPALANKNKCHRKAFSDHLRGSLPLTPRLFQNKTIIQSAHTGCRSFVTAQALTIASSCLFGTLREYFLNPSPFGNSLIVD